MMKKLLIKYKQNEQTLLGKAFKNTFSFQKLKNNKSRDIQLYKMSDLMLRYLWQILEIKLEFKKSQIKFFKFMDLLQVQKLTKANQKLR